MQEEIKLEELLADKFEVEVSDVHKKMDSLYQIAQGTYRVLTEEEADGLVNDYIEGNLANLCANNVLAKKLGYETYTIKIIKEQTGEPNTLMRDLARQNNMVHDLIKYVLNENSDRGSYIAYYDGEEVEMEWDGEFIYAYRIY